MDIQNCPVDNDYWAGAVKQCGGVSKLPTQTQLSKIAYSVYGTYDIGEQGQTTDLTLNPDKALELGFNASNFAIWSGDTGNGNYASYRYFQSNLTMAGNSVQRTQSSAYALCVK